MSRVPPARDGQESSRRSSLKVLSSVGWSIAFPCTVRVLFASVRTGTPRKLIEITPPSVACPSLPLPCSFLDHRERGSRFDRGRPRGRAASPVFYLRAQRCMWIWSRSCWFYVGSALSKILLGYFGNRVDCYSSNHHLFCFIYLFHRESIFLILVRSILNTS